MAIGGYLGEGPLATIAYVPAADSPERQPNRENPFSYDRLLRVRYRFNTEDWKKIFIKLAHGCGRGALVGSKGSGKTTMLEDLAIRLRYKGKEVTLIRLSAEFPHLPGSFNQAFFSNLSDRDAVLLDGAEQLSLGRWLRFRWQTRKAGFVVITTPFAGRLRTLHRCTTSPALLGELVSSLGQNLNPAEAAVLHQRHGGNIREVFRELGDRHRKKTVGRLSFPVLHA